MLYDGWLLRFADGRANHNILDEWLETAFWIEPVDAPHPKPWRRRVFRRTALPQRVAVVMRDGQACAYGYSISAHEKQANLRRTSCLFVDHNRGLAQTSLPTKVP